VEAIAKERLKAEGVKCKGLLCAEVAVATPDGIKFVGQAQSENQSKKSEPGDHASQKEHRRQTASKGHCMECEPKPPRLRSVQKAAVFPAEPVEEVGRRDRQNCDGHKKCNVHRSNRLTMFLTENIPAMLIITDKLGKPSEFHSHLSQSYGTDRKLQGGSGCGWNDFTPDPPPKLAQS